MSLITNNLSNGDSQSVESARATNTVQAQLSPYYCMNECAADIVGIDLTPLERPANILGGPDVR
jgi:hypothetical protein